MIHFYKWGYSSVVEHSTADREVTGSNPVAPFLFYVFLVLSVHNVLEYVLEIYNFDQSVSHEADTLAFKCINQFLLTAL